MRIDNSGTRVLFSPWSQISTCTSDSCLVLRTCPALLLKLKLISLSLCLSLYVSLSLFLPTSVSLESWCHTFTWDDPGWHISARGAVNVFTKILPPFYNPLYTIVSMFQWGHLCRNIYFSTQAILPTLFPFSALHCDPLSTSCVL